MLKRMHCWILVVSIIMVAITGCSTGNSTTNDLNENVLIITDIHFDPFTSCGITNSESAINCVTKLLVESSVANWQFPNLAPNDFGEETNQTFFQLGLDNLSKVVATQKINKIFVTGDLLSHHFPTQFESYVPNGTMQQHTQLSLNTMNYVLYKISQAVPGAKMYYIFGNNDTDTNDYQYPTESFMQQITPLIKDYMVSPNDFAATFSLGGYSKMPLNNNVDVIGLDFNPLTVENAQLAIDDVKALQQYNWLKEQLTLARSQNKKVIILQHEPFGVNTFNLVEYDSFGMVLQSEWQNLYVNLYTEYKDVITNFYYGHYHMENFTIVNGIFSFSTLGFSVDFYNNPGFKVLNIANTGELQNFTTYYSGYNVDKLLVWHKMYELNNAYNLLPSQYVEFFESQLKLNDKYWLEYAANYGGLNLTASESLMPTNSPKSWKYYYCSINNYESTTYNKCLNVN